MALLDRCVNPAEIEGLLTAAHDMEDRVPGNPTRRMGSSRRAAMVLISSRSWRRCTCRLRRREAPIWLHAGDDRGSE
jgi:hypothetical protein